MIVSRVKNSLFTRKAQRETTRDPLLICVSCSLSLRLFGCDENSGQEVESDGSNLNVPAHACPSYAATAALPTTVPVTATLTGNCGLVFHSEALWKKELVHI